MDRNINKVTWNPGSAAYKIYVHGILENQYVHTGKWSSYDVFQHQTSNTPGFRDLLRAGRYIPPRNLLRYEAYHGFPQGSWSRTQPWDRRKIEVTGYMSDILGLVYPEPPGSYVDGLLLEAEAELLQKCKNAKVNLVVSAAEASETAAMMAQTVTRVARAFLLTKKGKLADAWHQLTSGRDSFGPRGFRKRHYRPASTVNELQEQWMSMRYGWRPLYYDIHGAAEHLAYRLYAPSQSSKVESESVKRLASGTISVESHPTDHTVGTHKSNWSISLRAGVDFCADSVITQWTQLGFTNPGEVVWELMPLSFVVDWFLPVGTWIQNYDATFGLSFLGGWTNVETVNLIDHVFLARYDAGTWDKEECDASCLTKIKKVQRLTRSQFPRNNFPSFRNPWVNGADARLTDAMILLKQAFLG